MSVLPVPTEEVAICKEGGKGSILPLFDSEYEMSDASRSIIYGVFMVYFFLGVAILSDIFMGSIETITARKTQRMLRSGRIVTCRVWNETVANLSLMALGSSAPEILLAVTELFGKDMYFGKLGPATIVGSASFNLFMIVALCMFVIPSNETRKVQEVPVFIVTALFMFFAYAWLVIMVAVISPDIVEIWEAVLTLVLLPILVYTSYYADIGGFGEVGKTLEVRNEDVDRICDLLGDYDEETRGAIRSGISADHEIVNIILAPTPQDLAAIRKMVKKYLICKKSMAVRRAQSTRSKTGGRRVKWDQTPTYHSEGMGVSGVTGMCIEDVPVAAPKGSSVYGSLVQFAAETQQMSDCLSEKPIMLFRVGDCSAAIRVTLDIIGPPDSAAASGIIEADPDAVEDNGTVEEPVMAGSQDSMKTNSAVEKWSAHKAAELRRTNTDCSLNSVKCNFEAGQEITYVYVKRPSAVEVDGVEDEFLVEIREVVNLDEGAPAIAIGPINKTLVVMVKTAVPGQSQGYLTFGYHRLLIAGIPDEQIAQVIVQRMGGCQGAATCNWRTERLSSVPGFDYVELEGELSFEEGQTEHYIELQILPKSGSGRSDDFLVILEDPAGVDFNPYSDGGFDSEILTIELGCIHLPSSSNFVGHVLRWFDETFNADDFRLGFQEYREQMVAAIYCNGSKEDQAEASVIDWIFHIIAVPWKVIFMFVPPTAFFAGWVCFSVSLILIGGMTAFIGDLAELFGCVVGLPDLLTAISFVALGTSMPDLFASKSAAMSDSNADASIVNVTGSNCVNVFLGLGLPWTIGTIYWAVKPWDLEWAARYPDIARDRTDGKTMAFVVRAGDLAFSVTVFCVCACVALLILCVRRRTIGAELGGPMPLKLSASVTFVSMWFLFIAISFWWSLRKDVADATEMTTMFAVGVSAIVVPCLVFFAVAYRTPVWQDESQARASRPSMDSCEDGSADADTKSPKLQERAFEVPSPSPTLTRSRSCNSLAGCSVASETSLHTAQSGSGSEKSSQVRPQSPDNTGNLSDSSRSSKARDAPRSSKNKGRRPVAIPPNGCVGHALFPESKTYAGITVDIP